MEDVLTLNEAAEFLRVRPEVVRKMLHAGDIRGIKVGRSWRIRMEDIQTYLAGHNESRLYLFRTDGQRPLLFRVDDWDEKFDTKLKHARLNWKFLPGEPFEIEVHENMPDYTLTPVSFEDIGI